MQEFKELARFGVPEWEISELREAKRTLCEKAVFRGILLGIGILFAFELAVAGFVVYFTGF